jgi:hypothetical protein
VEEMVEEEVLTWWNNGGVNVVEVEKKIPPTQIFLGEKCERGYIFLSTVFFPPFFPPRFSTT